MTHNAPLPLLVTRPAEDGLAFVAGLPPHLRVRLHPVLSPLLRIVPIAPPPDLDMGPRDGAIFTSRHGVAFAPDGAGRAAYCVGQATTAAARARGWAAMETGPAADALVATLIETPPAAPALWHFGGVAVRGAIAVRLSQAGLNVRHVALYDQRLCPLNKEAKRLLASGGPVLVPLFSPRTARQFASQQSGNTGNFAHIIALSPAVAAALADIPRASLDIAAHPDIGALCAVLEKRLNLLCMG